VRPLALTAVLSYSSRQPQASPPIPLWLSSFTPVKDVTCPNVKLPLEDKTPE